MTKDATTRHDSGKELSEDRIFTLLSTGRRRGLLRALERASGEATVGEITTAIVTAEHGEDAATSERKAVYVSLHQTHVPRLVEAGVVAHDVEATTVRLTERAAVLLAYLRFDPGAPKQGLLSRLLGPDGRRRAK